MARVQSSSGKSYMKVHAGLGQNTEKVDIPDPSQPDSGPQNGESITVMVSATGGDMGVSFDGTTFFTVKSTATVPVVFHVRTRKIWLKGLAAGSGYELFVETASV